MYLIYIGNNNKIPGLSLENDLMNMKKEKERNIPKFIKILQ